MEPSKGTITRRMDSVMDGLKQEFQSFYTKQDFEKVFRQLEKAGMQSNRPSILKKLFDLLDSCGVSYEIGQDNSYYENLIHNLDLPADWKGLEKKILASLYEQYQEYPSPTEYLNRIVERLRSDEDHWEKDSLRVKVLKQFVKYGNCLTYYRNDEVNGRKKITIYGGESYIASYLKKKLNRRTVDPVADVDSIDDDIFFVLENATKDQKKPTGKYGILKMVNDLAQAQFRTEGATKRSLYFFAMVYGMTYYSGDVEHGELLDYRTDMEVNLFRDFYSNNLMRFLLDSYKGHLCDFERDPSGQGINYKNFAEMIYLYYIAKGEYTPQEKIRLSDGMIERVRIYGLEHGTPDKGANHCNTAYYRQNVKNGDGFFSEDILNLPEPEFEAYLYANYDCNTKPGNYTIAPIQVQAGQNTAYKVYSSILIDLKNLGMTPETCDYGLWITDVPALEKKDFKEIYEKYPNLDRNRFSDFLNLLAGANSFMKDSVARGKDDITRTTLIVAYYYLFNAEHEAEDALEQRSFGEVFQEFKCGVDEKLNEAYYQPFSSKNIFDVLVAFSVYAYMHM